MKFIKIASKRTKRDSFNVLKKNMNVGEAQEILKKLIQINSDEKHLVQLAKFYLEKNDLEIIAKIYRKYEKIKQRIEDITQFKTFQEFKQIVENTRSDENLGKAIELDQTTLKEHTNKILELFKEGVDLTSNYYRQYMTIENPEKQFNEFNTLQELANYINENIQANAGEIDESEFENLGNQKVEVYYAKNENESKKLSQGYGFCVGWETINQFWNYRLGNGERCFYFVRFKNRTPEENNYIVIQPRNDGTYQWTNTANNNGEPIVTEKQLKELFPELERFNFKETFKYIPLTEKERKYARQVSLEQFQDFDYDEKREYIEFGNELTEEQLLYLTGDLSNNKELIRDYINRLDEFLPKELIELIKDDNSLMSSYQHRTNGYLLKNIKDHIRKDKYFSPPDWARDWVKENIHLFLDVIKEYMINHRFSFPFWIAEDWVKENAHLFLDVIKRRMKDEIFPPHWAEDWVKENAHLFLDEIKEYMRKSAKSVGGRFSCPPYWAKDWVKENAHLFIDEIKEYMSDDSFLFPPYWARDWVKENAHLFIDEITEYIQKNNIYPLFFYETSLTEKRYNEIMSQRNIQEQSTEIKDTGVNNSSQETEEKEAKNWYKTYKIAKRNK
jgi:hypothetical protein